ncbi:MAG: hypothetical protein KDI36_13030 [Pseudomonadales bacterium]|nr:hypothetical protein [Pseudomonadales bacterium]
MMNLIVFLLGVHLTLVLMGNAYRLLDLFWCWQKSYPKVVTRLLLMMALIATIYWLLSPAQQNWFRNGQLFAVIFHIGNFYLLQFILEMLHRSHYPTVRRNDE